MKMKDILFNLVSWVAVGVMCIALFISSIIDKGESDEGMDPYI